MSIHGAKYLPTSEQLVTVGPKIHMDGLPFAVKVTSYSLDQVYILDVPDLVLDTWVYSALDRIAYHTVI